jgi:hypothetical protein
MEWQIERRTHANTREQMRRGSLVYALAHFSRQRSPASVNK